MILADTHLLGVQNGHWLDKLRREWQMHRSFQTSISLLKPDAVFFLGDLFDEGQWGNDEQFDKYADRFNDLFYMPEDVKRFTVMGNHDVGFHYAISQRNMDRFVKHFGLERGVEYFELNGNHFVMFNSMALGTFEQLMRILSSCILEGDHCHLCGKAVAELDSIAASFRCSLNKTKDCTTRLKAPYGRPILLQHFPLYRSSDMECLETDDLAPPQIRQEQFRAKWDCLSSESTNLILESLKPRAVFGGHVHFGCQRWWAAPFNFWEYTVASFSWRNNKHPSFLLVSVSPQELQISRCFIPHEDVVLYIYIVFSIVWSILFLILLKRNWFKIEKLKNRFQKPDRLVY
ncbi:Metallophosphoesterase 1 [Aphelenchoides bicaudatus]|nr:Metallophosphoesterase 1 [Aphelenchoides bicaudatus]